MIARLVQCARTHRLGILLSLAGAHLVLVALGAAQVDLTKWGTPGIVLANYSNFSGASSGYGFFAPGIGTHLRASFEVTDAGGEKRLDTLERKSSQESDLRVGNVVGMFWDSVKEEKLRRSMAASWAGKVLARHEGAKAVEVKLESYYLPTMADYRSGERGDWELFYRAKFVRNNKGSAQ